MADPAFRRSLDALLLVALSVVPLLGWPTDPMRFDVQNVGLGDRYRGRDYPIGLDASNGCEIGQEVRITYPKNFKVRGPDSVFVPAHSIVKVNMTLVLSTPPIPANPAPGTLGPCMPVTGDIVFEKDEFRSTRRVAGGTEEYICWKEERKHVLSMFLHQHGPPNPDEGGGGKKKPHGNLCKILFDHAEFFPAPGVLNPDQCQNEIREEATNYLDEIEPVKKVDPSLFEWLPKPADINHLSVRELVEMKRRAEEAAAKVKK